MPLLAATGYGGQPERDCGVYGDQHMVDYRKDVYRHLGTHCGGELGKKTQRNGPYWLGLFPHPGLYAGCHSYPVQIIDYSNVAQVYEVDNVPIGLAIPASLTTRVGNALIQSYEMVFALPDSVTYSKTGMLFGSNLVAKSTDFCHKILRLRRCFPITYKTV